MPVDQPIPRNLIEFQRRFGTEAACEAYLADLRWPEGFRCPRCGGERAYPIAKRRVRECASCGHQASTTAGTVLHRTRTDLTLWFLAAFLMVTDKRGLSALSLQRQIGVKRYETAWMMLHKLRRATVNANRTRLAGTIEVDEAWIGGEQKGLPGGRTRAGRAAALAVFAVEIRDERPQRLRIKLVPDDTAASLIGFIEEVAEPGSTIVTDGWRGYSPLPRHGFVHQRVVSGKGDKFVNPVPHTHVAIGNLKSWLIGTHKGVWKRHLAAYLDEFVFRYNRRRDLALAFRTLLGFGATREPTTYATIRGAGDLPKIVYTPSRKERGRPKRPPGRRARDPQNTPAAPVAQGGMRLFPREPDGHLPNGPFRGGAPGCSLAAVGRAACGRPALLAGAETKSGGAA
jgi:transposase-like protein